jgi:hypothetical protein
MELNFSYMKPNTGPKYSRSNKHNLFYFICRNAWHNRFKGKYIICCRIIHSFQISFGFLLNLFSYKNYISFLIKKFL